MIEVRLRFNAGTSSGPVIRKVMHSLYSGGIPGVLVSRSKSCSWDKERGTAAPAGRGVIRCAAVTFDAALPRIYLSMSLRLASERDVTDDIGDCLATTCRENRPSAGYLMLKLLLILAPIKSPLKPACYFLGRPMLGQNNL